MPELNYFFPMDIHTENYKEHYEICHNNIGVEEWPRDITNGEYAGDIQPFEGTLCRL